MKTNKLSQKMVAAEVGVANSSYIAKWLQGKPTVKDSVMMQWLRRRTIDDATDEEEDDDEDEEEGEWVPVSSSISPHPSVLIYQSSSISPHPSVLMYKALVSQIWLRKFEMMVYIW
jgi:hypothetical protein